VRRELESVLVATSQLLDEGGLAAVTVDEISARSGVSAASILELWPNPYAIAAEAFGRQAAEAIPLPDTGSAASDLSELARRVSEFYSGRSGTTVLQLIAACAVDRDTAGHFREFFLTGRRANVAELWQRAIDRGEVDVEIDVETAADLLFGPLIFRLICGHAPLRAAEADALTLAALHGLLAK